MDKTVKNINNDPEVPKGSYDLRILQALRRIIRAVDLHSHKLSSQHKITGPQLACLLAVKQDGPLTSGNLAKNVYLSPSTVVGIVDRLEEKQLVMRKRSSEDRRQVHISITPTGKALVAAAPSLLQDTLATALVDLPEIEQVSITLALEKLVDLMEARHIGASPLLETGSLTAEE
ncbi:MarR family winged helix-turn-helix transcriptional regulator [uncultured Desulfuromusa sp.]|uniref:MarR family winged helix-turn-helix transcriptional regulator n=1 Tax=uncultured Desulfuromusa sp. TaxID=219183 RepID=UPI002AA80F9F|nr:MarR family winged helix-turn-helix transcriptional regulator [uncultured Desulfuromusa sp.]